MTAAAYMDYVELSESKTATLRSFYGAIWGWVFQDYGDAYAGCKDGHSEGEADGISAYTPTPTPTVILRAEDFEVARAAVLAASGELVGEDHVFLDGRRLHFREPAGNDLALWTKV